MDFLEVPETHLLQSQSHLFVCGSFMLGGSSSVDCTSGFAASLYSVDSKGASTTRGKLTVPRCGLGAAAVESLGQVLFAGGNTGHG